MTEAPLEAPVKPSGRIFYGWWIVAVSIIVDTLKHGAVNIGFTVFLIPIQNELGISRAAYSLADTIGRLMGGFQGPVVGYLTDRLGPAAMMMAGGALVGLGFVLLYFTHSYLQFLLVWVGVIFVGSRTGYNNASTAAVIQWFRRKRGLAMSILSVGNGLGGVIFGPLMGLLVFTLLGWRSTALLAGVVILAVVVPLSMLVRRSPETMGLLPDGDRAEPTPLPQRAEPSQRDRTSPFGAAGVATSGQNSEVRPATSRPSRDTDFTANEAMRTPSYWLFVLAVGLRNTVHSGVRGPHLVPLMVWFLLAGDREETESLVIASLFVGVMSSVTFINPFVGWLGDKWSKQKISAVAMLVGALALVVLLNSSGNLWQLAVFAILLGLSEIVESPGLGDHG